MSAPDATEPTNFAGLQARIVPLVAELFATLATRNPLRMYFADIAGKTLLDIVQVLRHEGISQEAIAASLGLTLNGYHAKMKRLQALHVPEDQPESGEARTLLERVFSFVADRGEEGGTTLRAITDAFRGVKADSLNGVLHFLVRSALLSVEGRGRDRRYAVVMRPGEAPPNEHDAAVLLYREGPMTRAELARRLECSVEDATRLVERLAAEGTARAVGELEGETTWRAVDYHIPLDHTEGYEAAIFDHLAAVIQAVCKKLRLGRHHASLGDLIGGATFTFRVPVDDPLYDEVSVFLRENRVLLERWLARARAISDAGLEGRAVRRFTLYVGQSVEDED